MGLKPLGGGGKRLDGSLRFLTSGGEEHLVQLQVNEQPERFEQQ